MDQFRSARAATRRGRARAARDFGERRAEQATASALALVLEISAARRLCQPALGLRYAALMLMKLFMYVRKTAGTGSNHNKN